MRGILRYPAENTMLERYHFYEDRLRRLLMNPHLVAIVMLVFLWVIFFWRLYTPVIEDRVIFPQGDFTGHHFAFSSYQAERLLNGEIPLWNPYNHGGSPFAADPQSATFYPPRWISIGVSGYNEWTLADLQREVAAHYLGASLLMYAFLRVATQRSSAAIIGSVIFTYSGYLTSFPMLQITILQSAIWLPLVLLGVHLSLTRQEWVIRGILIGSLGLGLSILGGHPQTNLQVGYLSLAYLLFLGYHLHLSIRGIVGRVLLLFGAGALLGAVQLVPSIEFTNLSSRIDQYTYIDKSSGFAISDTLQVVFPHLFGDYSPLYIGVVGILLALGAMLRRTPTNLFWTAVVIVSLFVSFGNHTIVYDIFYLFVPGMGLFRQQERFALGVSFGLAVLAAYQTNWFVQRNPSGQIQPISHIQQLYRERFQWLGYGHSALTVTVAGIVLFSRVLQGKDLADTTTNALMLVALISILFLLWQRWQAAEQDNALMVSGALLVLIMVDLFTIASQSPNFVANIPENYVQEPAALSVMQVKDSAEVQWRVDGEIGLQNYGTFFQIPDVYGTSPLYLNSVANLRELPADRYWEIFAVRYVTTPEVIIDGTDALVLAEGRNFDGELYSVFELENPRPLVYLTYTYTQATSQNELFSLLANPDIDLRETVLIRADIDLELPAERPLDANVRDLVFNSPEDFSLKVETSENAVLTLAIPYYPGWQAEVDGEQVEIVETYGGLMGIPIEGQNDVQEIRFYFRPTIFLWSSLTSTLTALLMLGYGVGWPLWQRRQVIKASDFPIEDEDDAVATTEELA